MCDYRESRESWEWASLAPFASHSSDPSLNWRRSNNITERPSDTHFPETRAAEDKGPVEDPAGALSRFKTAFQLDKERITSSTAFRRLEHKTQMFVSHVGDHYRTRLTHTIEVNETARFVAQALQLNEDLVDAIALGHDLGHTPFGHSGEEVLNALFRKYWPKNKKEITTEEGIYGGAFYHNIQSVRVVDSLEKGYEWDRRPIIAENKLHNPISARGRGLDLTWAVREGILKHSSRGLRQNDIRMYGSEYLMHELNPFQPATLEGQVVEFADEIASMMHDLEDGLRSRLFTLRDLRQEASEQLRRSASTLEDLLGLTGRFVHQHRDAPRMQSRILKMQSLKEEIRNGDDCTVGTVLAFLRSILISNLIEASYTRLIHAMYGMSEIDPHFFNPPSTTHEATQDDLIWLHFEIDRSPDLKISGYCPEAWDVEPTKRKATVQTFTRTEQEIENFAPSEEAVQVIWYSRTTNMSESRRVIVWREDGTVWGYPLGNVCITFGGAKLIGYDKNLLDLRSWLRREFIPERLHRNSKILRMNDKGQRWLSDLFNLFYERPHVIHHKALARFGMWQMANEDPKRLKQDPAFILRLVEHLQGMTDRYLAEEYARLLLHESKMTETDEMSVVDCE
jgi:predicted deoxyguanosinetriphosphate triphosphohydrolase